MAEYKTKEERVYPVASTWTIEKDQFILFVPQVPGTTQFLKSTMSITALCMASWTQLSDDAIRQLLDKAQAETERRRALRASQAVDPKPE